MKQAGDGTVANARQDDRAAALLTVPRDPAGQRACHFPLADSGREVRALIASLLL